MQVVKRNGKSEEVRLEKIVKRIQVQSRGLKQVDAMSIATKVIAGLYESVTTKELDELAIKTSASMATQHYEYDILSARLATSVLHKETKMSFVEVMEDLFTRKDSFGVERPAVSDEFMKIVRKHKSVLDSTIVHSRDFDFDYLGLETLKKSYLQRINGKIVERPQHLWLRVAVGIHGKDIDAAIDTYEKLSKKSFTHATPTLFNAGTAKPQLASCFLVHIHEDSISGIFKSLSDCAKISQLAGGLGMHHHIIRATGSPIYGTNGTSNGLVPMLRVFNAMASYVDQCFTGETKIDTDRSWKQIKDIEPGKDSVITSDGVCHTVLDKKEFKYSGDGIEVSVLDINNKFGIPKREVRVTPEHIFLVVREAGHMSNQDIVTRLKKGVLHPTWVEAKELVSSDVIISNEVENGN